jgi:hypothetical protein
LQVFHDVVHVVADCVIADAESPGDLLARSRVIWQKPKSIPRDMGFIVTDAGQASVATTNRLNRSARSTRSDLNGNGPKSKPKPIYLIRRQIVILARHNFK